MEKAGIENIIFETSDITSKPEKNEPNADTQVTPYYGPEFYVGDRIVGTTMASTLGACVTIGSKKGYITTAHGNANGDVFSLNGRTLGTVTDIGYGGTADISFIEQTSDSVYDLINHVRLRNGSTMITGGLNEAGSPTEGAVVCLVCFGSESGYRLSVVESFSGTAYVNGKKFTRMLVLDNYGDSGDSGGPVMEYLGNREYRLVGIYKGYDDDYNGLATRWDTVEDIFGCKLY